nr:MULTISPECIES: hypothetical protein [unclassified Frondihabitans]
MSADEGGDPFSPSLLEVVEDRFDPPRIKAGRGLIHNQQAGFPDKGSGYLGAAEFSAREALGRFIEVRRKRQEFGNRLGGGIAVAARYRSAKVESQRNVLTHRQ